MRITLLLRYAAVVLCAACDSASAIEDSEVYPQFTEFTPDGIPVVDESGSITMAISQIHSGFGRITHGTGVSIPAGVTHTVNGTVQDGNSIPLPLEHARNGLSWPWDPYYDDWTPPVTCNDWPNALAVLSAEHQAYWFLRGLGLEMDQRQSADTYSCQNETSWRCPARGIIAPIFDPTPCTSSSGGTSIINEDMDCYTTWIEVEISYNGGVTWQHFWSGYAEVCE